MKEPTTSLIRQRLALALAGLLALLANSCAHRAEIVCAFPKGAEFTGLKERLDPPSPGSQTVHFVFLHGMSHGRPDMQREVQFGETDTRRIEILLAALEQAGLYDGKLTAPKPTLSRHDLVNLNESAVELNNGVELRFYQLNYSEYFTRPCGEEAYPTDEDGKPRWSIDKRDLHNWDFGPSGRGAILNRELKRKVMTWGLADATIYLNPERGAQIRRGVGSAIEDIAAKTDQSPGSVVFVSRSLGSKVLFDSLAELYAIRRESFSRNETATARMLKKTQTVYMMANQWPLLELGTQTTQRSLPYLIEEGLIPETLELVNFTQPSDILTYPIIPIARKYSKNKNGVKIEAFEVEVKNAATIIPGLIDHPLRAHQNHFDNPHVIDFLMNGSKP